MGGVLLDLPALLQGDETDKGEEAETVFLSRGEHKGHGQADSSSVPER